MNTLNVWIPNRPNRNRLQGYISFSLVCLVSMLLSVPSQVAAADAPLAGDRIPTQRGDLIIHPINHATLALGWDKLIIYVDPVGGAKRFAELPPPDLILLTDIHGDHLNLETLQAIVKDQTKLIASSAAHAQLSPALQQKTTILTNHQTSSLAGLKVEAIPAYNLTPERLKFHAQGRGNGYVLTLADKRIYLSGDTEDIPEMKALKDIDVAFVCMNLPYTMEVTQAAAAIRAFRPKIVYPYHSRGSDLTKFRQLVGDDVGVEVRLRDWYAP